MRSDIATGENGLCESGAGMRLFDYLWQEAIDEYDKVERQKRKIDRIAQKAEAAQRLVKRGKWV